MSTNTKADELTEIRAELATLAKNTAEVKADIAAAFALLDEFEEIVAEYVERFRRDEPTDT